MRREIADIGKQIASAPYVAKDEFKEFVQEVRGWIMRREEHEVQSQRDFRNSFLYPLLLVFVGALVSGILTFAMTRALGG